MPTCCDCGQEAGKKYFSKSQLKKPPAKRRCTGCAIQLASTSDVKPKVPMPDLLCCICLDDEVTGSNPIVRDCACRGTAGHVHIQCLVRFAQVKSKQMLDNEEIESGEVFGPNNPNPWETCMTCKQDFCKFSISCAVLAEAALEIYSAPDSNRFWHKNALRANISREEAHGNVEKAFHFATSLFSVLRFENMLHENDGAGVLIACELCLALSKVLSLKGDRDENKWCKIERHLNRSEAMLDSLDESDQELLAVLEARIDIMRMRSVIAVGRDNYEAAATYQEFAVKALCELEGESMRSSDELWRLSELLFEFIDTNAGMKKGRKSLRIAETLRGGHDATVKKRKSFLAKISDSFRVRKAPAICQCFANYSFGIITVGDEIDIVQFLPNKEQSPYQYIVRKKAVMNVVDCSSVILQNGTKVKILDTDNPFLDGRYGEIIASNSLKPSAPTKYAVEIKSLNLVINTSQCYVTAPAATHCKK